MGRLIKQIIKFGFVGGTAFIIDYGVMILLTEACDINYLISSCISFSISVLYNYIMSIRWVFDVDETRNKKVEFILFMVLSVIGLGINQLLMWFGVAVLHIFYMLTKIGATVVVMVYNFVTRKVFLEKR